MKAQAMIPTTVKFEAIAIGERFAVDGDIYERRETEPFLAPRAGGDGTRQSFSNAINVETKEKCLFGHGYEVVRVGRSRE